MDTIGVTYGTATPHEAKANIVNQEIGLFDFLIAGQTLTQISELKVESNISKSDAKKIALGEEKGSRFDVLATLEVIGDLNGDFSRRLHPIMPGTDLELATSKMIADYLGFKVTDDMILIGKLLRRSDVPVVIEYKWFKKHISIMGMTGSGKSNLSKIILEQIIKWEDARIVIIDPHGEYGTVGNTIMVDQIGGNAYEVDLELVIERLYKLIPKEKVIIKEIIDISKTSRKIRLNNLKGMAAILEAASDYYISGGNEIKKYILEAIKTETIIKDISNKIINLDTNIPLVINVMGMKHEQAESIVEMIAELILELGKAGIERITFIDEVHNYAPQKKKAISKDAIITLISEGRKFGCGVIIMSQRPAKVDKDIISQCNTKFCLKLTNDNDIRQVRYSTEYSNREMFREVQVLEPGECLLSSPWIKRPVFIAIDEFKEDEDEEI